MWVGKVVFCEKLIDFLLEWVKICLEMVNVVGGILMFGFNCCFDLYFKVVWNVIDIG